MQSNKPVELESLESKDIKLAKNGEVSHEIVLCTIAEIFFKEKMTVESFGQVEELMKSLFSMMGDSSSDVFKYSLRKFNEIYESSKIASPIWNLLISKIMFTMFTSTIPSSGLPLSHDHIKKCLLYGKKIINFPEINTKEDDIVFAIYDDIKAFTYDWLAGIYERRGLAETEKQGVQATSDNVLIQESLTYYKEAVKLAKDSQFLKYFETSDALSKYAGKQFDYLPNDVTLEGGKTQQAIKAIEDSIEFHSNVPFHKRTTMEGWDAERKEMIHKGMLGKLYAKIPQSKDKLPNYEKAMSYFNQVKGRYADYAQIGGVKQNVEEKQREATKNDAQKKKFDGSGDQEAYLLYSLFSSIEEHLLKMSKESEVKSISHPKI